MRLRCKRYLKMHVHDRQRARRRSRSLDGRRAISPTKAKRSAAGERRAPGVSFAATTGVAKDDGRRDFDFLFGRWQVRNRKLRDPLSPDSSDWIEFLAAVEARPILDGLGNTDSFTAEDFPGRGRFHGFTLRLFDEEAELWRIWWASTIGQGQLDPPLVGRFDAGVGVFLATDMIAGREVKVRFTWRSLDDANAPWEQEFSFDGGISFSSNWTMNFRRLAESPRL